MRPALFLDRDGVVNREVGYLSRAEQVEWVDGIWELCRRAAAAGMALVIVTNQSGIARGYYSEDDLHTLMRWMREEFAARGLTLTAYYFCPHHPDGDAACTCRKPLPGMLLQAAQEHTLDLPHSAMVGDRCGDIAAANAAGVGRAFLLRGTEAELCPGEYTAVETLDEVELSVAAATPSP